MSNLVYLKVAHERQRNMGECLVACARMALAYCGKSVSYHKLFKTLDIIPDAGTPSFYIKRLENFGVSVLYKQGTIGDLRQYLLRGLPCIAFVNTKELPYWQATTLHAVVVAGMDDEFIYLNDPAFPTAPYQVRIGDFDLAWLENDERYAVVVCAE